MIYNIDFLNGKNEKSDFEKKIRKIIGSIRENENADLGDVNIVFCNDEFIREYNKEYLGHDYETDIITFYDKDEHGKTEGELLISIDRVRDNSKKYSSGFRSEIYRVISHGILHLCGYDDKTGKGKLLMRKKENYYLKKIRLS